MAQIPPDLTIIALLSPKVFHSQMCFVSLLRPRVFFQFSNNAKDMRGKVACVTGANSGIGFYVAKALAEKNAAVHMVCRNQARGEEARSRVLAETGNENVYLHVLDVSDFQQVCVLLSPCGSGGRVHSVRTLCVVCCIRGSAHLLISTTQQTVLSTECDVEMTAFTIKSTARKGVPPRTAERTTQATKKKSKFPYPNLLNYTGWLGGHSVRDRRERVAV